MVAVGISAHPLLAIYGAVYEEKATDLLRILTLALVPLVLNEVFFARFRIQGQLAWLIAGEGLIAVLSAALAYSLGGLWDLMGIGIAWLISRVTVLGIQAVLSRYRVALG